MEDVIIGVPEHRFHGFHCKCLQDKVINRHNRLYTVLKTCVTESFPLAAMGTEVVLYNALHPENHHKCDIHMLVNGSTYIVDFAVCNSVASSRILRWAGAAFKTAEDAKRRLYQDSLVGVEDIFVPFIMLIEGRKR